MIKWLNKENGFTLFELLVVISIIGILISLAMVSYTNAQIKARDSRGKSDIKAASDTFEQYFAGNDTYASCDTMAASSWVGPWPPTDPRGRQRGTADYSYTLNDDNCTASGYCICVELEQAVGGNASNNSCPSPSWVSNGAYFCLVNQQ